MRIIELIPSLQVGGAERFVVDLSNSFAKKGHEVVLVTLYDKSPDSVFEDELKGVRRIELHKKLGLDFQCLLSVLKLITQVKPDIVHSHGEAIKYLLFPAILYKRCNYYATIHSDAKYDSGSGLNLWIRSFLYERHLVKPVTISQISRDSFRQLFDLDAPLIENGCTNYPKNENTVPDYHSDVDYLFVHVASIQPVKNQVVLIRAFEQLLEKGIKARLLFLGRAHDAAIYAELEKHWSDYIVYLGQRSNVRDYMHKADAFCLTSITEGMPITVIEALSVGCPPLVTPAGGCVNLVQNGVNGLISDSFSADSFFTVLERFAYLTDDERKEMRLKAMRSFEDRYNIDITADRYLDLFLAK